MKKLLTTIAASVLVASVFNVTPVYAWDGADTETGEIVEIDPGNLVKTGSNIEIYNSDDGEYSSADVQSITSYGDSVVIEVYDYEADEFRELQMDGSGY